VTSFKKKILSGGAWAFSGKVLMSLSALAINALLTRLLSPEDMGAYFLLLSLTSFFAILAQFGLTQTIVKLVAESMGVNQPSRARLAVRLSVRLLGIGLLIVMYLLAYGLGAWISEHLLHSEAIAQVIGLSAIWVVILSSQSLISEIYRGFHDIKLATLFGGLTTSIFAMLLFLFIWLNIKQSNLQEVILLTLIAGGVSVFISSLFLGAKISKLEKPKGNELTLKDITKIAPPLWVTNIMFFILGQSDLWIMGFYGINDQIAIYGTAARIITLVTMPLMIINSVIPPIISEMYAQRKLEQLETRLRNIATISGVPSIVIICILSIYGSDVLALLFGDYYADGGTILIILGIGQLINVWAGSCGLVLMLTGHEKTMMAITVFSGIFTILLSWHFVHLYEGIGVAIAASVGIVMQNIIMLAAVRLKLNIWTHIDFKSIPILLKQLLGEIKLTTKC